MSPRRALLPGVAVLVSLSAVLAVAILLFGDFGETEGRVLGTTAVLAAHGALVVPATLLLDRGTARALALSLVGAAVAGALCWSWVIWVDSGGDGPWRLAGTTATLVVALAQVSATTARRRPSDPSAVRGLHLASIGLAALRRSSWCWCGAAGRTARRSAASWPRWRTSAPSPSSPSWHGPPRPGGRCDCG